MQRNTGRCCATNRKGRRAALLGIGILLTGLGGVAAAQQDPPRDLWIAAVDGDAEAARELIWLFGVGSVSQERALPAKGLHAAAADGDTARAQRILENGADSDKRDARGWTPLIYACRAGDISMVELLLERGAEVNRCAELGTAPLTFAAVRGHTEVVRLLLQHGADPGLTGDPNKIFPPPPALYVASAAGHLDVVKLLLSHGADAVQAHSVEQEDPRSDQLYALVPAAVYGHEKIVDLLLHHNGAFVHKGRWELNVFGDEEGFGVLPNPIESELRIKTNPLHEAVVYMTNMNTAEQFDETRMRILKRLLRIQDRKRAWPVDTAAVLSSELVRAAAGGNLSRVKQLLGQGRETPMRELALALRVSEQEGRMTVTQYLRPIAKQRARRITGPIRLLDRLHTAIQRGEHERVIRMVLRGVDPNRGDAQGYTALHQSAGKGDVEMIRFLIRHGAEIGKVNDPGRTPIDVAAVNDHSEAVRVMIAEGGEVNPKNLSTALAALAGEGRVEEVRRLLGLGADPNAKAIWGGKALTEAAKHGHLGVIRLLLENGAEVNASSNGGSVALAWARNQRHEQIVSELKAAGARPEPGLSLPSPLALPLDKGDTERVKELLQAGVDPNGRVLSVPGGPRSILDHALRWRKGEAALALLDAGAELTEGAAEHAPNGEALDHTPSSLLRAVDGWVGGARQLEVIRRLLERGGDVNAITGGNHRTPVMTAARFGNTAALELLLEAPEPPDLGLTDKNGKTALQLAIDHNQPQAAAILRRAGATE